MSYAEAERRVRAETGIMENNQDSEGSVNKELGTDDRSVIMIGER